MFNSCCCCDCASCDELEYQELLPDDMCFDSLDLPEALDAEQRPTCRDYACSVRRVQGFSSFLRNRSTSFKGRCSYRGGEVGDRGAWPIRACWSIRASTYGYVCVQVENADVRGRGTVVCRGTVFCVPQSVLMCDPSFGKKENVGFSTTLNDLRNLDSPCVRTGRRAEIHSRLPPK